MDGCPTFFVSKHVPAPIPTPTGPLWFYRDPDLCGALTFDELMDTTVQPKANQLQFRVDAAVSDTDVFTWGTDVMAQSDIVLPGLTPTDVDMILLVEQNKYRTALGSKVPVYDLPAFHVIPTGVIVQGGPFARFTITFNLGMKTTSEPAEDELEYIIDGVPQNISDIAWLTPTTLQISTFETIPSPSVSSIELLQATNNVRSSLDKIMCPFLVEANFP